MPKSTSPTWLVPRNYVHFDRKLSAKKIAARVQDPEYVAQHGFMPLIGRELSEPRYRNDSGTVEIKSRPIKYASHLDAHIYSYYAELLAKPYEAFLSKNNLSPIVLSYRKHQLPNATGGKCNAHFANEVFEWIKLAGNCSAFAFDIEGFFDSLDHLSLKENWLHLTGKSSLPKDHYQVFRAITKYAWVDHQALAHALGHSRNFLERNRAPYTSPATFRSLIAKAGLIQVNTNPFGIPQGTPISAILSNIAMMQFDLDIARQVEAWGGLYRRYSDDILVVVSPGHGRSASGLINDALQQYSNRRLQLNERKTIVSNFSPDRSRLVADVPLSYLGFDFNGERKLIRARTLAKYHGRMTRAVRSAKRAASKSANKGGDSRVWKRELYEKYSHLGDRNFVSYAYRCSAIMSASEIKRQLRGHWKKLHKLLD